MPKTRFGKWSVGVIFFILVIFIGTLLVMRYQKTKNDIVMKQLVLLPSETPTLAQQSEIHSSDGTMNLIMQTETKKDQPKNYSFFVADISGENKRLLFTKTTGLQEKMSLPLNSFSPDNKYLYLEEKKPGFVDVLVFKVSGETFANGEQYLDVGQLLAKSKAGYHINHVTGWVSPIFIQINTIKDDLTKGPSYWFDVESHAFWQQ